MALANEYALGLGSGLSLAALDGTANYLAQFNRRTVSGARRPVGIRSQPVDEFPIREGALSGRERGDGTIAHQWQMVLATYGVKAFLDRYTASGTIVSTAVTLNTRMHPLATFKRYNAYLILPKPGQDIEYVRQNVFRVTVRFGDLVAL